MLFRYAVGSESTERREQGFLDEVAAISKKQDNNQAYLDDQVCRRHGGHGGEGGRTALDPVRSEVDGIFAVNESATSGMLNAMRKQKLEGKIMLVGFDSSAPLLQAVREGDVAGLVVQDPYRMGYLGSVDPGAAPGRL